MKNAILRRVIPIIKYCSTSSGLCAYIFFSSCSTRQIAQKPEIYQRGTVSISKAMLPGCHQTMGKSQPGVMQVKSDDELKKHYGLSFWIRFRDSVSPPLYGALYFQSQQQNLYCMALPNGYFASFYDRPVEKRSNIIQEVCHPIQLCPFKIKSI